jgi:hypothetical protein
MTSSRPTIAESHRLCVNLMDYCAHDSKAIAPLAGKLANSSPSGQGCQWTSVTARGRTWELPVGSAPASRSAPRRPGHRYAGFDDLLPDRFKEERSSGAGRADHQVLAALYPFQGLQRLLGGQRDRRGARVPHVEGFPVGTPLLGGARPVSGVLVPLFLRSAVL